MLNVRRDPELFLSLSNVFDTELRWNNPGQVAVAPKVNRVFVACGIERERKDEDWISIFDLDGNYQSKIHPPPTNTRESNIATGVAVDESARLLFVSSSNCAIHCFSLSSSASVSYLRSFFPPVSGSLSSSSKFTSLHSHFLALHPSSRRIYLADSFQSRILIFSYSGTFLSSFGSEGSAETQFSRIGGIAIDEYGKKVIVSDSKSGWVSVWNLDGILQRRWELNYMVPPRGLCVKGKYLFICRTNGLRIETLDESEEPQQFYDKLKWPISVDGADGKLYVVTDSPKQLVIIAAQPWPAPPKTNTPYTSYTSASPLSTSAFASSASAFLTSSASPNGVVRKNRPLPQSQSTSTPKKQITITPSKNKLTPQINKGTKRIRVSDPLNNNNQEQEEEKEDIEIAGMEEDVPTSVKRISRPSNGPMKGTPMQKPKSKINPESNFTSAISSSSTSNSSKKYKTTETESGEQNENGQEGWKFWSIGKVFQSVLSAVGVSPPNSARTTNENGTTEDNSGNMMEQIDSDS